MSTAILDLPIEEFVHPGNRACTGCGLGIAYRTALKAFGSDTILVVPPSCLTVLQGLYPIAATKLPCLNVVFASTAAAASGVKAALRAQGRESTNVVAFAGDGGTGDIGIQALSGAAERGEDIVFICYDNEAYMNTGVQRSGSTPKGALTTTTPITGKLQPKKDVPAIMAAHGLSYVATASAAYPLDLYDKLIKAKDLPGTKYIHIHTPCPSGWGFDSAQTVTLGKLAVECGLVELYEIEDGYCRLTGVSAQLGSTRERIPVSEYIKRQSRFRVLPASELEAMQAMVDQRWRASRAEIA